MPPLAPSVVTSPLASVHRSAAFLRGARRRSFIMAAAPKAKRLRGLDERPAVAHTESQSLQRSGKRAVRAAGDHRMHPITRQELTRRSVLAGAVVAPAILSWRAAEAQPASVEQGNSNRDADLIAGQGKGGIQCTRTEEPFPSFPSPSTR